MVNIGAQLGQVYQTVMPAYSDNADIQDAFLMLWNGDPNSDDPMAARGIEAHFKNIAADIEDLEQRKSVEILVSPTEPQRNTQDYNDWIWIDTSSVQADGAARPLFVWNGSGWSQVAGSADPAASYDWAGAQKFAGSVIFHKPLNAFSSPQARTQGLHQAVNGTLSFVDNKYEVYSDGSWKSLVPSEKVVESRPDAATVMSLADVDKVLRFTNAAASTYTVNSNQIKVGSSVYLSRTSGATLQLIAGAGVTILSQNLVLGENATATLTKVASDTWIVQGTGTVVPSGGTTGQVLVKASSRDYDAAWLSVVPQSGGSFTGPVATTELSSESISSNVINIPSGGLIIGGRRIFVQPSQPTTMGQNDVWIPA